MATKFTYEITTVPLNIINRQEDEMIEVVKAVPYLLYEVERIKDGKKIVINKPGGKRSYGRLAQNDMMVFIYDESIKELWLISHNEIYEDIKMKIETNIDYGLKVIKAMEMVCNGKDPDEVLKVITDTEELGVNLETLLKVSKWIWLQEDINYPNGEGRWLSMKKLLELKVDVEKQE